MSDQLESTAPVEAEPNAGIAIPGEAQPVDQAVDSGDNEPRVDDTETRARAMGWVPKDEFRGPADKWRDAAEFVRHGEQELPILRERNRDLSRKVSEIERDYQQRFQRLEHMSTLALAKQREQIVASYTQAMRSAVEMGDVQRYDQLMQDYGQRIGEFDQQIQERAQPVEKQPAPPAQLPPEVVAIRRDFEARNPWFNTDPELNLAAQRHHLRLQREKPGLSMAENLAETEKAVKAEYASRFGIAHKVSPSVEPGGGRMPSSGARTKGASDLPADARRQGEKFVREGLFKDLNEYAREYFTQD